MPYLKKPYNRAAVAGADDDFYQRHPEMVVNGRRQPINNNDPGQNSLRDEWIDLYLANGGELAKDVSVDGDFEVVWLPDEKIDRFREGPKKGTPVTAFKAHVYFARATRLVVEDQWPLAEYYVYIDTDLSNTIDFDTLGLLWTDEKGFPHFCDGDGKPQERVGFFPFSYSTATPKGMSCVLIYDTDLDRLKKKRASLQGTNGRDSPHRVTGLSFSDAGSGLYDVADIEVPIDNAVLPYDEIVHVAKECDALLAKARDAQQALKTFMGSTPEHEVMWLHRDAINGWLAIGDHRNYLTRMDGTRANWDVACQTFDKQFKKLTSAYENALRPLYDKLSDSEVRRKLFLCGYVTVGWRDPKGYHGLWSCHFFAEAISMFAGTLKHKEVFDKFVQPLLIGFSANWGEIRSKCKCPTCSEIEQVQDPFADVKRDEYFGKLNMTLKDGKVASTTVQRIVDIFTKFASNFGLIIAMKEDFDTKDVSKIGFLGPNIFKRGGAVGKGLFKSFVSAWVEHCKQIAQRSKDFEDHAKDLENARKAIFQKHFRMDPGKVGNALGIAGGAITIAYFFTKEGHSTKDWVDLTKGGADILKGAVGLSKDQLAERLTEKYGKEAVKKFADKLAKGLGVAGAALQLGSAYLSLADAADKGDSHAFVWGAVQYMGADIYLTGVAVEFTPFIGVSQATGAVVAVIGGVVYVGGQIGEFVFRPGAEEKFLRGFYYYDNNDHRTPAEKESDWEKERARRQQERWDRFMEKR